MNEHDTFSNHGCFADFGVPVEGGRERWTDRRVASMRCSSRSVDKGSTARPSRRHHSPASRCESRCRWLYPPSPIFDEKKNDFPPFSSLSRDAPETKPWQVLSVVSTTCDTAITTNDETPQ